MMIADEYKLVCVEWNDLIATDCRCSWWVPSL